MTRAMQKKRKRRRDVVRCDKAKDARTGPLVHLYSKGFRVELIPIYVINTHA